MNGSDHSKVATLRQAQRTAVIPAQAGIQTGPASSTISRWIPADAGMTAHF